MRRLDALLLGSAMTVATLAAAENPAEIIRKSVAVTETNWKTAPAYSFLERDVVKKGRGTEEMKNYQVLMIEGSTYNRLIGRNGRPLSPSEQKQEEQKLKAEIQKRSNESPSERQKRLAKYQHERDDDHLMLKEMTRAFDYKMVGEETVKGRRCWVLDAIPRPDYQPPNMRARVLTGMRGRMWVDQSEYQWVRVHVEVLQPVSFGYVLAKVNPGTRFDLEQAPVEGKIWMPSRFAMTLNLRKLWMEENSDREETYRNYRRMEVNAMLNLPPRSW